MADSSFNQTAFSDNRKCMTCALGIYFFSFCHRLDMRLCRRAWALSVGFRRHGRISVVIPFYNIAFLLINFQYVLIEIIVYFSIYYTYFFKQ